MPAALLALALLAATVDPRLAEPLRLLAQLRDAAGVPVGALYAREGQGACSWHGGVREWRRQLDAVNIALS